MLPLFQAAPLARLADAFWRAGARGPEESEGVSGKKGRLSDLEAPRSGLSLPVIRS